MTRWRGWDKVRRPQIDLIADAFERLLKRCLAPVAAQLGELEYRLERLEAERHKETDHERSVP